MTRKRKERPYEALGRPLRRRTLGGLRALLRLAAFRPPLDRRRYSRLPGLRARARRRRHPDCRGASTSWSRRIRNPPRETRDRPAFFDGAADEDVHTLVIRKLKERVGALADKIHTGRSRNEQVSLDVRLWLRDEIDAHRGLLLGLMESLLACARRNPDAVIPGYTHLRRAQAVLWPHYLLAYFEMFARDLERLQQARARVNVSAARLRRAGRLAAFPSTAKPLLAIWASPRSRNNSMDVSADRDFALDFLYAASTTMLHLSRLAEDWILYSSEEFGWIELGDGVTSGSSLMPQKKNPDSLELIRGKSGRVFGDLTSLFVTMKGLPVHLQSRHAGR